MGDVTVHSDARGVKVYSIETILNLFEFSGASQQVKLSSDGQYVVATGVYPPTVKIFELEELGLKVERRVDCEVVDFLLLSEDFSKLVFLLADRTVAFHAAYGKHYELRIPKFGRCMAYQPTNCDLLLGGAGSEMYRLNLEEGRFQEPLHVPFDGVNAIGLSKVHQLIAAGGESSVHFVDPRSRSGLGTLNIPDGDVTCVKHNEDGLTLVVGTTTGFVFLYDLRSSKPVQQRQHINELPIKAIEFFRGKKLLLSADAKSMKVWDYCTSPEHRDGELKLYCTVEGKADINDVCIVRDHSRDSGLVFAAGEQPQVQSYFLPSIAPAPRWCSFLEGLTEELEEDSAVTVYDDYKFVTETELQELNAESLKGTPLLRGYMHGYFMDEKLYHKLKQVKNPFAYEDYRKQKLKEKIEEKRSSRISIKKRLPKVNAALAQRMLEKGRKLQGGAPAKEESEEKEEKATNPTGDARFASLFTDERFQVDEESEEFRLRNPSGVARKRGRREIADDLSEDEALEIPRRSESPDSDST